MCYPTQYHCPIHEFYSVSTTSFQTVFFLFNHGNSLVKYYFPLWLVLKQLLYAAFEDAYTRMYRMVSNGLIKIWKLCYISNKFTFNNNTVFTSCERKHKFYFINFINSVCKTADFASNQLVIFTVKYTSNNDFFYILLKEIKEIKRKNEDIYSNFNIS